MIRFAITITAVELALTLAAAFMVSLSGDIEPYLTTEDLAELDLPYKDYQARRRSAGFSDSANYMTRAELLAPPQVVEVSYRVGMYPDDYQKMLSRERAVQRQAVAGEVTVIDDPFPGERGHASRQHSPAQVRAELVRLRGNQILIVKVSREMDSGERPEPAGATCERRARIVQQHLMEKFGWR